MKKQFFWRVYHTICAALCVWPCLVAAEVTDLVSVYQQALGNDSVFRSAAAVREASLEVIPQTRAALLPALVLGADRSLVDQLKSYPQRYTVNDWNLSLVQPLFRWDRWLSFKQADTKAAQVERNFQAAAQWLLLRVTSAYFDVLAAEDTLRVAAAETSAMNRQLAVAKERLKVGAAILTEEHEAQSRLDFAQAQEIAAQNDHENRREVLREIAGILPEHLAALQEDVSFPPPNPPDPEQWVASSRDNNPSLQVARLQVQVAESEVKKATAGHMPTVDLVLSHSYQYNHGSQQWFGGYASDANTAMVQMKLPLFLGGQVASGERQAAAGLEQAHDDLDTADRRVVRETRNAFRTVNSSLAQVKAYRQALVSAKSMLDTTMEGWQVGFRTMVDVLNAQRDYFQAQRDWSTARHNYVLGSFQLKSMNGSLSPADLAAVNQWLVR